MQKLHINYMKTQNELMNFQIEFFLIYANDLI